MEDEEKYIPQGDWKTHPSVTVWKPTKKQEIKKSWRYEKKKQVVGELETEIITKKESSNEIVSERLSQRTKIRTAMVNPYLRKSNYLDDLKNEDTFLRPKMSSFEKTKKE
jgi:hypothetical protein|uniref:Uncharacterized protein n=1 Tax=viral metagenome TaxID=1070528 RepID=A0A6C0IQW7_9ZZZZ